MINRLSLLLAGLHVPVLLFASAIWAQSPEPRLIVQAGHSSSVLELALGARASLLASIGDDETAKVWDVATALEIWTFPTGGGDDVSFSPDGRVLALPDSGGVQLRDLESGLRTAAFEVPGDVRDLAFTPEGQWLVVVGQNREMSGPRGWIELRHPSSGALVHQTRTEWVNAASVAGAGGQMATGHAIGSASGNPTGEVRLWSLSDSLAHTATLQLPAPVASVAFSPGGTRVAAAATDGSLRVWEVGSADPTHVFERVFDARYANIPKPIAFSSNDEILLAGVAGDTGGGAIHMWNAASGELLFAQRLHDEEPAALTVVQQVYASAAGAEITVIDLARERVATVEPGAAWAGGIEISENAAFVSVLQDGVNIWGLEQGRPVQRAPLESGSAAAALHPTGDWTAVWQWSTVRRIDRRSGKVDWETALSDRGSVTFGTPGLAFHPSGRWLFSTSDNDTVHVLDAATGTRLHAFRAAADGFVAGWVRVSPDGRLLAVTGMDSTRATSDRSAYRVWEIEEQAGRISVSGGVKLGDGLSASTVPDDLGAFGPNGARFVGGDGYGVSIWDTATGERILGLEGASLPVAYSPGGEHVAAALDAETIGVYSARDGSLLHRLSGPFEAIASLRFTPDGAHLLSAGWDQTTRVWRTVDGAEVARLVAFDGGDWVVVTPDGRFDTSDLERTLPLHWVMPDEPLRPLPLEIFMRDYYEPRLLPRVLAGEELPTVPSLARINRVQPEVGIAAIAAEPGDSTFSVTVTVEERSRETGPGGRSVTSGARDLHLFRDGQIVGLVEGDLISEAGSGSRTFTGIRWPRTGADSAEISAYAFNVDGVKSATTRATTAVSPTLAPRRGRAYVISLGVNAYSDPAWNLAFAANDARIFQTVLAERLSAASRYEEVVGISLISDHEPAASTSAEKEVFRGVIDLLAGREVDPAVLARIPGGERLRAATPEDLVLISISTHGYTDASGTFYLLPQDIGAPLDGRRSITPELLRHAISSDELSEWLLGVDAGDMAMIVDACHSAAAVEGAGFKPGPMGSRGLGQLAFNKGMRILAASQAADVALESDQLQQGLLTYALVQDGLRRGGADHEPADGQIHLEEWLAYGVLRVPELYREVLTGEVEAEGVADDRGFGMGIQAGGADPLFQQPSLFDFSRRSTPVSLGAPSR